MMWGEEDLPESTVQALVADFVDKQMPAFRYQMPFDTVYENFFSAFNASVRASYKRLGVKMIRKAADDFDYSVDFELTNQFYLDALYNDANYLLNIKSRSYDQTTKDQLVDIVKKGRLNRDTIVCHPETTKRPPEGERFVNHVLRARWMAGRTGAISKTV